MEIRLQASFLNSSHTLLRGFQIPPGSRRLDLCFGYSKHHGKNYQERLLASHFSTLFFIRQSSKTGLIRYKLYSCANSIERESGPNQ